MDVKQTLERLTPETERLPDWDGVLQDARPSRARWAAPRLAIVGAVVGLAALLMVAPWTSENGVVDRALAAVGEGRVVHVLVRVNPQGTVIDLASGRRAPVFADIEQWYEPGVGLRQRVVRANGSLEPGNLPFIRRVSPQYAEALRRFATGYRDALGRGDASVVAEATLFARRVYWIRLRSGSARVRLEVAVDATTYRPLYLRERIDGRIRPGSGSRILAVDTVAVVPTTAPPPTESDGPTAPPPTESDGPPTMFGIERTGRLTLDKADAFMGRSALWLGPEHAGLPLAWVGGLEYSQGRVERWSQIKGRWRGLELVYGDVNNFGFPVRTETYVRIEQQTEPAGAPGGFASEGTLVSYGRSGVARTNGVTVYIDATSESLVVSAARAVRPISAGSGAGG